MHHRTELMVLIERNAAPTEIYAYFLDTYGYSSQATEAILKESGISLPPSKKIWSQEERKRYLQNLSTTDLESWGSQGGASWGAEVG